MERSIHKENNVLAKSVGSEGERLARKFLEQKGLKFITANWLCKMGEIDVIMQADDTRVFVEVKTRRPTTFGLGLETVAYQKQQKILRAVKFYQQKEDYWGNVRFDVISIEMAPGKEPIITHIPDAF